MDVNLALSPQAILFDKIDSKSGVLVAAAQLLADAYGLDRHEVLENLEAREALGSTGFGRGVAIPHCRSRMCGALAGADPAGAADRFRRRGFAPRDAGLCAGFARE
jgi:Phosphotransferase system mannitol/fructose-specific IIA domain (Ntr-type)